MPGHAGKNADGLRAVLFPAVARSFPGQRLAKILARAVHVPCVCGLFGGHLFDVGPDQVTPWLFATIATGCFILLLDLYQSGAFLLQVRGVVLFGKLGLLSATRWFPGSTVELLGSIVVVSVLSSHAPSKFRYFLVFGRGRVAAAKTPG